MIIRSLSILLKMLKKIQKKYKCGLIMLQKSGKQNNLIQCHIQIKCQILMSSYKYGLKKLKMHYNQSKFLVKKQILAQKITVNLLVLSLTFLCMQLLIKQTSSNPCMSCSLFTLNSIRTSISNKIRMMDSNMIKCNCKSTENTMTL